MNGGGTPLTPQSREGDGHSAWGAVAPSSAGRGCAHERVPHSRHCGPGRHARASPWQHIRVPLVPPSRLCVRLTSYPAPPGRGRVERGTRDGHASPPARGGRVGRGGGPDLVHSPTPHPGLSPAPGHGPRLGLDPKSCSWPRSPSRS